MLLIGAVLLGVVTGGAVGVMAVSSAMMGGADGGPNHAGPAPRRQPNPDSISDSVPTTERLVASRHAGATGSGSAWAMAGSGGLPAQSPAAPAGGRGASAAEGHGTPQHGGGDATASGAGVAEGAAAGTQSAGRGQPPEWERLYLAGHQAQSSSRLDDAVALYSQASALDPSHPAILYDLGYVLELQGRDEAAMDNYKRAIELNPQHGYALYNLGWLMRKAGDHGAAITLYRRAIAVDPASEVAARARAQLEELLVEAETRS